MGATEFLKKKIRWIEVFFTKPLLQPSSYFAVTAGYFCRHNQGSVTSTEALNNYIQYYSRSSGQPAVLSVDSHAAAHDTTAASSVRLTLAQTTVGLLQLLLLAAAAAATSYIGGQSSAKYTTK